MSYDQNFIDLSDDEIRVRARQAGIFTGFAVLLILALAFACSGCTSPNRLMTDHARQARRGVAMLVSATVAAESSCQPAVDALGRATLEHLDEIVRLGELTERAE